jgi:hypothetical protein
MRLWLPQLVVLIFGMPFVALGFFVELVYRSFYAGQQIADQWIRSIPTMKEIEDDEEFD